MRMNTREEFSKAKFAEHPDGRIAARVAYLSNHPWIVQAGSVWVWATDQEMADRGWHIVTPAPDLSDPDVIEQAAKRARDAYQAGHAYPWEDVGEDFKDRWRAAVRAVYTLPPARDPEAEKLEADLRDGGVGYGTGMRVDAIADYLVAQGWTKRVGGGEDA